MSLVDAFGVVLQAPSLNIHILGITHGTDTQHEGGAPPFQRKETGTACRAMLEISDKAPSISRMT